MWLLTFISNTAWTVINFPVVAVQALSKVISNTLNFNFIIISTVVQVLSRIGRGICLFLSLMADTLICLLEEFNVFLHEVAETIGKAVDATGNYTRNGLTTIFNGAVYFVTVVLNAATAISEGTCFFASNLWETLVFVWKVIGNVFELIFRSIIWMLQMIPISICGVITWCSQTLFWMATYMKNVIVVFSVNSKDFLLIFVRKMSSILMYPVYISRDAFYSVPLNAWLGLLIVLTLMFVFRYRYIKLSSLGRMGKKAARALVLSLLWFPRKIEVVAAAVFSSSVAKLQLQKDILELECRMCVVCTDEEKCIALFPCRHVCLCVKCWSTIRERGDNCPICRKPVREGIHVFL